MTRGPEQLARIGTTQQRNRASRPVSTRRTWRNRAARAAPLRFGLALWLVACSGCSMLRSTKPGERLPPEVYVIAPNGQHIRKPEVTTWRAALHKNVVIQQFDYSCGASALATLLRFYFQDNVNEELVMRAIFIRIAKSSDPNSELRDRIQNGFSMLDLLNVAKDLGYLGAVVRIPLEKLRESPAPVLVRIEKNGYLHFVIVRGFVGDRVFLADPARGNIRLAVDEFTKQWSGEALFLGKIGFGLPKKHPLAIDPNTTAQPELDIVRQQLFPPRS